MFAVGCCVNDYSIRIHENRRERSHTSLPPLAKVKICNPPIYPCQWLIASAIFLSHLYFYNRGMPVVALIQMTAAQQLLPPSPLEHIRRKQPLRQFLCRTPVP